MSRLVTASFGTLSYLLYFITAVLLSDKFVVLALKVKDCKKS